MSPRSLAVRLAGATLAAFLIAIAGYGAYWQWLAGAAKDAVAVWQAARRAEGWTVSHEGLDVGGFPSEVRLVIAAPELRTPDGFGWRTKTLVAKVSPLTPRQAVLVPAERQEVEFPLGNSPMSARLDARAAEIRVRLPAEGGVRVAATLGPAVVTWSEEGAVSVASLAVDVVAARPEPAAESSESTISLSAREVALPDVNSPLGRRIGAFTMRARLQGRLDLHRPIAAEAARWRDDGGVAEIENLAIVWGPLDMAMEGTLALDGRLQPMAAMTGTLRGYAETVDLFVRGGQVRPADGRAVKLMLALMARSPAGGGPPQIKVPLTAQDGLFYVGPVAVAKVPLIVWPPGYSTSAK
ncbi:MAG: DUF2125 domain-containing protein [Rhodospirillales bacterium]|nr:DUF2125 domain-containing protein [Rhodospirillales bacterium]